jgi:hypothetical protein
MESHDEERMAYKNINYGNAIGSYNIKDTATSTIRNEMCAAFLMSIPGPKMIWQFGELGYDYPINYCVNGTVNNNCRLDDKPIRWDYKQQARRQHLNTIYSSLSNLRYNGWYKDVFTANNITLSRDLSSAVKWMTIRSATDSSQLLIVGNFDVINQTGSVTFPAAGTWYDYLKGTTFAATGSPQSIALVPGEYHVYLNRNVVNPFVITTPIVDTTVPGNALQVLVYPNPVAANSAIKVFIPENNNVQIDMWNAQGQKVTAIFAGTLTKGNHIIPLSGKTDNLPAGIYLLKVQTNNNSRSVKVLIP